MHPFEVIAWLGFTLAAAVYVWTLWGDPYRRRALAYLATLASGTVALVVSALSFSPAPLWSLETFLYPASFLVSSLLLGATASGMLLGHWYLIDVGMPLAPFLRMWRLYRTSLVLQLATLAVSVAAPARRRRERDVCGVARALDASTASCSGLVSVWVRSPRS